MTIHRIKDLPNLEDVNSFEDVNRELGRLRDALQEDKSERIQDFDILQLNNVPWIDVRGYGAKIDGTTDDTKAIHAATADMVEGDTLYVPKGSGNCVVTNVVFNPPDDCSLFCETIFESSSAGVAVNIGDEADGSSERRHRYRIIGLRVKNSTADDWSAGRVGVRLVSLYESYIDIRGIGGFEEEVVDGFEKNLECIGDNSHGFVYNEIHLGRIVDGKKLIYLDVNDSGWTNQNHFYGGHMSFTTWINDYTGCVVLTIVHDATHHLNQNVFMNPSFESNNATALAATIEGTYNTLFHPRTEGTGGITLGSDSLHCNVYFSYGQTNTVTNNGTKNTIFDNNEIIFHSGINGSAVTIRNVGSNTYKNYKGESTNGTETFSVTAGGIQYLYNNLGIRTSSFGTGMDRGIAISKGGAPSTSPTDVAQIYAADQTGGNTCVHTRTEDGKVVKLYQQAHIADAPGDTTANNATTINAILVALENAGFLATS